MKPATIIIKIQQRVNKLSSDDFANIPQWSVLEAFNKAQLDWCRANLHGLNAVHEGAEQSTSRIDDLDLLLTPTEPLTFQDKGIYYESDVSEWPSNYMRYNRMDMTAVNSCCDEVKRMTVYLAEEANVDVYLDDVARRPSYPWGETFTTVVGKTLHVYHNKQFQIDKGAMIYYREPVNVTMTGVVDIYTGIAATGDVDCEFPDNLANIICVAAAAILEGDWENYNKMMSLRQQVDNNN